MKSLVLVAASAAAIGLTACSHGSDHSASPAGHSTGKPITPISCSQQYRTWNRGDGKGLMGALDAVTSAASARHAHVLTTALKQARPAVTRGARHPIPACADPRGFWNVLLMHVNAAVAEKATASSVRAAMQGVPGIYRQLELEVKQAAE